MKTVNLSPSKLMKKNLVWLMTLSTAVCGTVLSHAGDERPARAAVEHAIHVRHVSGPVDYAYDSTGWKPLMAGKILHAGASIRTGSEANVVLAMEEQGSLVRVGPMRKLELAKAAPAHEVGVTIVPLQARIEKAGAMATTVAAR